MDERRWRSIAPVLAALALATLYVGWLGLCIGAVLGIIIDQNATDAGTIAGIGLGLLMAGCGTLVLWGIADGTS